MSSKTKPARNRLRRSCDVCFKSKTKCDDHRPCNQCVRRKCEDRCLTTSQNPGVLEGIQRASTTPFDRRTKSEARPTKSTANGPSPRSTPARGFSHDVQPEPRENVKTQEHTQHQHQHQQHQQQQQQQRVQQTTQQPPQTPTHNSYQTLTPQQRYRPESPFAASLNYEHQANTHARHSNGFTSLEHTWSVEGPGKGRTHYLWLLRKFPGILPYIDEELREARVLKALAEAHSYGPPDSPRNIDQHRSEILATVFNEIPKRDVCIGLIDVFFNTYAQVFPILDHNEFEKSYYVVMSSPDVFVRDINFVVMLLLVLLLGNTLLDKDRQGLSAMIVTRWLALVQSWHNKAMENASFGFEQIHTFVLFNLARQVTRVTPEADYICLGAAIRAAMLNGTHKPPQLLFGTGYTARVPWTALIELDLQGSIATGLMPTTAPIMAQDELTKKSSSLFINEIWTALANTIHLRHEILLKLNSELTIKHQHAIELARELTTVVGPILKSSRKPENAFAYEYLNFIYKRFLFALHRPFALIDDPAYHFSQRICSSLSFQHIERICRIHQTPPSSRTPFENLLVGYNTMFWEESFQSAMFLCHSLLRTQSVEDEIMDTIMLGTAATGGIVGNGGNGGNGGSGGGFSDQDSANGSTTNGSSSSRHHSTATTTATTSSSYHPSQPPPQQQQQQQQYHHHHSHQPSSSSTIYQQASSHNYYTNISMSSISSILHLYLPIAGQTLQECCGTHSSYSTSPSSPSYFPASMSQSSMWLAEQAYLVPAITLAYLDISKQFAERERERELHMHKINSVGSSSVNDDRHKNGICTSNGSDTANDNTGGGGGGAAAVGSSTTSPGEEWEAMWKATQRDVVARCLELEGGGR